MRRALGRTRPTAEPTSVAAENGPGAPASVLEAAIAADLLYEVVDGKIVEKEMGARDVEIGGRLFMHLGTFAWAHRLGRALGEFIFRIDQARDLQRRPDVAFVSYQRWAKNRPVPRTDNAWDVVPNLTVEVVIPTDAAEELQSG